MNILPGIFGRSLRLENAKALVVNFAPDERLPETTTSVCLGCSGPIASYQASFIFDYEIFPPFIMRAETEWMKARRQIQRGDIILQKAVFPLIAQVVFAEFAVRVSEIFKEEKKLGFAYETLSGHIERGISEFYFEERESKLLFTIHTFSKPNHWVACLFSPLALLYQRWCTNQALLHVKQRFIDKNCHLSGTSSSAGDSM